MASFPVLVVVLNYHGESVLLPCLASLFPELEDGDQCLVIDNGGEGSLLKQALTQFPQLRTVTLEENRGFAAGMNVGLKQALLGTYKAVWLLNNDTLVQRGALQALKQAVQTRTGLNLFSPLILTPEKKVWFAGGTIDYVRMRTQHEHSLPRTNRPFRSRFLTGCALFIPRETLEKIGLLDERYFLYYEDAAYSWRTEMNQGQLWVVPQSVIVHHEVSVYSPDKLYWLVRSGVEFFLRATPKYLRWWTYLFLWLRRGKNVWDRFMRPSPIAEAINRAYTDASIS